MSSTTGQELQLPFERGCSFNLAKYNALQANWTYSKATIQTLREEFKAHLDGFEHKASIRTLALAGSLGRMEASEESDADLIVVLRDGTPEAVQGEVQAHLYALLERLCIPLPNPEGLFAQPCTIETLCGQVGSFYEDIKTVGKRLLLLLESQPVYEDKEYHNISQRILEKYSAHYTQEDPTKEWTFLLNDLIRYFRALCVNYQFTFDTDNPKWALRNIKLRHSRLIMYGGMLALLGEASKERDDKHELLRKGLCWTPLERLHHSYKQNNDHSFHRIAGHYNAFLYQLNQKEARDSLKGVSYQNRYDSTYYALLKANSDGLVAELLRFVLARRNQWSERFFEYLFF
jgi:predicted nucleotidyltransferase